MAARGIVKSRCFRVIKGKEVKGNHSIEFFFPTRVWSPIRVLEKDGN